jgi:hypothetical protein
MSWVNGTPCADLDGLVWPENITASLPPTATDVSPRPREAEAGV